MRCRLLLIILILPCAAALLVTRLQAENRFYLEDHALPHEGTAQPITLLADNDEPIRGYSIGVRLNPAHLALTAVDDQGTIAQGAEYFAGRFDGARGLVGYGCIFDFELTPASLLPAGTGRHIARLLVDVLGAAGTVTPVVFESVAIDPEPDRPPVRNVLTNELGLSVPPGLEAGDITIEDRCPRIRDILDNQGRPGQSFRVIGEFFGEPGLVVTVCQSVAPATLEPDGRTLLVTAPDCAPAGFAAVEVCTNCGCDARADGFNYLPPSQTDFVRGNVNGDLSVDISDGIAILRFLFLGGPPAECRDAMDTNDGGEVDLSDASYVFNFLFIGGPAMPPPYPLAGTDPTADTLPGC